MLAPETLGKAPERRKRPVVVQKYGGSSVADLEKIGRVADRVVAARREGFDVVVVVSAMGKTTDGLLAMARTASGATEPPRRELDMLLSTGERVSMSLLSIAIQARGAEAISFTGSQSGILTNDRHFDARIIEVRPHRIEDELARGKIVIVAGYQGMSYRREITTLGRGGSDTTAVALAAALSAERCEIYSDVDGVYSADPRAVPEARHLEQLDAAVLQEMAECGAKVVCAQAVEWARRAGIAIHARATSDPAPAPRETVVRERGGAGEPSRTDAIRAVVAEPSLALVHVPPGALGLLARAQAESGVSLKDLSISSAGGVGVVSLLNVPDWQAARARLAAALPGARIEEPAAGLSVVGDGLTATPEPLAAFLACLEEAGASPSLVVAGPLRLGAVVAPARLAPASRALHAAFVERPGA